MGEKILEVRVFELRYTCDVLKDDKKCEGALINLGERLDVPGRPLFKHRCVKCGDVRFLNGIYPMPMMLPINEPIPQEWADKIDRENVSHPPGEQKIVLS